jgi:hypothetical protein
VTSVFWCEGILDFLSEEQRRQLSTKFAVSSLSVMPHEISGPLGIKYSDAVAVLTVLQTKHLCQNFLLVYHTCEPDLAIASYPFEQGFPELPWECTNCQRVIESIEEISFGIMALTSDSINFV